MKTTLNWYKREANYYNTLGQRLLKKEYNFAGVGKFAALCDILVTLPYCSLDMKKDANSVAMLGLDLDFKPDEFIKFINDLLKFDLLIYTKTGKVTTPEIQESLQITLEERAKSYFRKYGEYPKATFTDTYTNSSPELLESSPEPLESSATNQENRENFSQREREEREEKPEKAEREIFAKQVFTKDFIKECSEIYKVDVLKIENKQEEFLKYQKLSRKKWKNSADFRTHFLNWTKKEIEKENKPKKSNQKVAVTGKVDY